MSLTLLSAAALIGSALGSIEPVLTHQHASLGGGLTAWTIGIDFTADGLNQSAYFDLSFESSHIIQQQAAGMDVNELGQALVAGGTDPNYDLLFDSYFLTGPGTLWATSVPPHNGVVLATGAPGSDLYTASYASPPATPIFGAVGILYLVTDRPDGRVEYSGVIARDGEDYFVSGAFEIPEPSSALLLGSAIATQALLWFFGKRRIA